MKKILKIIVLLAVLAITAGYIINHKEEFMQLRIVSPFSILLLTVFFLADLFFLGLFNKFLLLPFNIKIGHKEAFGISVITRFYNFISAFEGGAIAKAVYLKKKYKFPYSNFLSVASAIYIVVFLVGSLSGIISMIFIKLIYGEFNHLIFTVFATTFLILLAVVIFSPKFPLSGKKWIDKFIDVLNKWHLIKNDRKIICITIMISVFQVLMASIGTIVVYHIFGIDVAFFKAMFIVAISYASVMFSITPGNLGVAEVINVFSAKLMGIQTNEAIAVAVFLRIFNLTLLFIMGPIFSYWLMRNLEKNEGKNK